VLRALLTAAACLTVATACNLTTSGNTAHDGGAAGAAGASGWQTVGGAKVAPGSAYNGRIAVSGGTSYAAYVDGNTSKLTVAKSTGTTWVPVGGASFTPDTLSSYDGFTIAVDGSTPYVAYRATSTYGVNVMKFNGTSWSSVGAPNFATAYSYGSLTLAVSGGTPYVAFTNGTGAPMVMSYNGTSWASLTAGISATYVSYLMFGLVDGTPYIAYNDSTSSQLVLMRYTGSTWMQVATSPVTMDEAWDPVIAGGGSQVFLIYSNSTYGAVVQQLVGSTLQSVGTLGSISNGDYIEYVTGAVYNGVPYVGFDDEARDNDPNPQAATVKNWNGSSWALYAGYANPCDIEDTVLFADQSTGKLYFTYSDCQGDMTVQVH
jgi:hypothetical protein